MVNQDKEEISSESTISWPAYHATYSTDKCVKEKQSAASCLLPLFYDVAHTEAMICHSMKVVKKAVSFLNGDQTPVIAMDQPLFTIAKRIQWSLPELYGEQKFVIMFGGLHIEMALFRVLGELLSGSGWTSAICDAEIASSGTADSLLKASHVVKTRHTPQVTSASL